MMRGTWLLIPAILSGCATVSNVPDSQLTSGEYTRLKDEPGGKRVKERLYLEVKEDSIQAIPIDENGQASGSPYAVLEGNRFMKPSFDIDVLVIVFKYRPEVPSLPSQLTTDFNGNMFLGYRKDWFTIRDHATPFGRQRKVRQRSVTLGGFAGVGTTFVSPWTTNQQTTDEYSGFIYSNGFSGMLGFKALTVGVGVGWDYLVDRDKDIWIYQGKPWFGLALSLNLN